MFSRKNDASKIALVHLVALLRHCHFDLLDTQFQTDHLAQFGTFEVTRMNYHHLLADSIRRPAQLIPPKDATGKADWGYLLAPFLQPVIQRS